MKLTEVFTSDLSDKEKVAEIAKIVETARTNYGNDKEDIPEGVVNTTEGYQEISMLCDKSKVAIADAEVSTIKITAVELTRQTPGLLLNRKIEELIATSSLLANITNTIDSDYI